MHASFETSAFRKMHKLRLLSINKMLLSGSFEDIFEELRWLSWQGCSLESLPINFQPTNLVFLDLRRSNFKTLWNGPKVSYYEFYYISKQKEKLIIHFPHLTTKNAVSATTEDPKYQWLHILEENPRLQQNSVH